MSKINETNYPRRTQASYEDTDMLVIQKAGGNTYTTRIEDLREDCQETLAPALNTMRENFATIEGITASKAYAKGDYLVFGGRLCKAKTSIAVNATLILDTNIELAPVGDELSSISSDLAYKVINAGVANSVTVTNSRWILPNTVLNGYTGNYLCISGLPGGETNAAISYNNLIGIGWTFKDANDHSPTTFSGTYNIAFAIIKV